MVSQSWLITHFFLISTGSSEAFCLCFPELPLYYKNTSLFLCFCVFQNVLHDAGQVQEKLKKARFITLLDPGDMQLGKDPRTPGGEKQEWRCFGALRP